MAEVAELVTRAKGGGDAAYGAIVRPFQGVAVGYRYAMLGSLTTAEDAGKRLFINAYHDLPALREPVAFPGWFRRVVHKEADRLRWCRRPLVCLHRIPDLVSPDPDPAEAVEKRESQDRVAKVIAALPERQRVTVQYTA